MTILQVIQCLLLLGIIFCVSYLWNAFLLWLSFGRKK